MDVIARPPLPPGLRNSEARKHMSLGHMPAVKGDGGVFIKILSKLIL